MGDDPSPGDRQWSDRDLAGSELSDALRDVTRLAALARPALARRLGLSLSEVWALEHLIAEPMGTVELARRLDMTSAATTVLVHRLEALGHVSRAPHPQDRRRVVLGPSEAAAAAVIGRLRSLFDGFQAAEDSLDPCDAEVVTAYLHQVRSAFTRFLDETSP